MLDGEIHPCGQHDGGPNLFFPDGHENRQRRGAQEPPIGAGRIARIKGLPQCQRIKMHRRPLADQRAVNLHDLVLAVDRFVEPPAPWIDERCGEGCGGPRNKLFQAQESRRAAVRKEHVAEFKEDSGAEQPQAGDEAEVQIGPCEKYYGQEPQAHGLAAIISPDHAEHRGKEHRREKFSPWNRAKGDGRNRHDRENCNEPPA